MEQPLPQSPGAPLTREELASLNATFAAASPSEVLGWGLERFGNRIALASSFGAEDVVLIDMLASIDPGARVFTLDTLRLHTETYDLIDRIRERYGLEIEVLHPALSDVGAMVREHGNNLFYRSVENRKLCCQIRKVVPLEGMLTGLDAWITGIRADQAATRTDAAVIEVDTAHPGMLKLNPLTHWTSDQVWAYIREHDVPYNALHDRGFPSIGCEPCTRAVEPGEDPRAGRWWWEQDAAAKECGIHVAYDAGGKPTVVRGADPAHADR
jgi:phosphoadenosine phosphosulfate reductase